MTQSIKLNQDNLAAIASHVKTPSYNRDALNTSIVHISVGGFHRSHQAYFLNQLFEKSDANNDWGIYGVSAMPGDRPLYDALRGQDYLYSLLTMSQSDTTTEIIGSIVDGCFAPDNLTHVMSKIADAGTKIVSLTITEWGYYNDADGNLDQTHDDIKYDMQNPESPKTVLFLIVQGLKKRLVNHGDKITLLSCDNLQGNGHILQKMIGQIIDMIAPEIKGWVAENVTFPNSMVDRITPVRNADDVDYLTNNYNVTDDAPVRCEPFIQWVVEDKFAADRPALEDVGVQFVNDVAPYEKMKLRLLNANHSALCYVGFLAGHSYVHEAATEPSIRKFMHHVMDELEPTLDDVPGIDLNDYKNAVVERFSNPVIADTLLRICGGGSEKFVQFFFGALHDLLAAGKTTKYTAMAMAGWIQFLRQHPDQIDDPIADELRAATQNAETAVDNIFNLNDFYKALKDHPDFIAQVQTYYDLIGEAGSLKALDSLV